MADHTHKRAAEPTALPALVVVLYLVYVGGCAQWGTSLAAPTSSSLRADYALTVVSAVTAATSFLAVGAVGWRWVGWLGIAADAGDKWYARIAAAADAVADSLLVVTAAVTAGALLLAHSLGAAGKVPLDHMAVNIVVVPVLQLAFKRTSALAATVGVAACFAAGVGSAVATGAATHEVGAVVGVHLVLFAIVWEIERVTHAEHARRGEDTAHRQLREELGTQSSTAARLELNLQLVRYVNDEIRTPLHFALLGLEVLRGQVRAVCV